MGNLNYCPEISAASWPTFPLFSNGTRIVFIKSSGNSPLSYTCILLHNIAELFNVFTGIFNPFRSYFATLLRFSGLYVLACLISIAVKNVLSPTVSSFIFELGSNFFDFSFSFRVHVFFHFILISIRLLNNSPLFYY